MSEDGWRAVATAAQATLDDLDDVIGAVTKAIRDQVSDYVLVTDDELQAAIRRNVGGMLRALQERRHLGQAELADFATTVEERARNGVAIEAYLLAVGVAEAEVWEHLWRRAPEVPDGRRVEAFALRFANVQLVTRVTVAAHRRIELRAAREDQERRGVALRLLLGGGLPEPEAREHLARLGLVADQAYVVVRARARSAAGAERLTQLLTAGPDAGNPVAFALWGEDTVGLLRDRPSEVRGVTAGVAGPVDLTRLPEAYEEASQAFATAWGLGREGSFHLGDLGIKAAVQADPEVGRALRRRYLAPLLASGSLGSELLATARAYLEAGSSREAAAARLHLHQNTVGYRLNRFSELTGADLSDLTTLAELHWLFTDLELRPEG